MPPYLKRWVSLFMHALMPPPAFRPENVPWNDWKCFQRLSHSIGMIIKTRHFLKKHCLIAVYCSFLYPYLSYCNHSCESTYKTNLKRLTTLQDKAIRIISQLNARKNCDAMYNELGIIQFVNINKYLIGRFIFCVYQGQDSEFFSPFCEKRWYPSTWNQVGWSLPYSTGQTWFEYDRYQVQRSNNLE